MNEPHRSGIRSGRGLRRRAGFMLVALACSTAVAGRAGAVTHLKHGAEAPPVRLADLDGVAVDTSALKDRTIVLVFGELYHEKTMAACAVIEAALAGDRTLEKTVVPMLVVTQNAPPEALRGQATAAGLSWPVLHDVDRRAFGAFRVTVMPSVVVVDGRGRVVHAMAGHSLRIADIVRDAVLVSGGKLSLEEFGKTLHPGRGVQVGEAEKRATRLTSLARQLLRRGFADLAEEKFIEAIETVPTHVPARLGLANLRLQRGRLADAEAEFLAVLSVEPHLVDARLGLAYLRTLRGGDEVAEAESVLQEVLRGNPTESRAHYLIGLIRQEQGRYEEAASSFRIAAEVLMSQRGTWQVVPEGGDPAGGTGP